MGGKKPDAKRIAQVCRLLRRGEPIRQITKRVRMASATVRGIAAQYGIETRKRKVAPVPSLKEISERAAEVRAGWTEEERIERTVRRDG